MSWWVWWLVLVGAIAVTIGLFAAWAYLGGRVNRDREL